MACAHDDDRGGENAPRLLLEGGGPWVLSDDQKRQPCLVRWEIQSIRRSAPAGLQPVAMIVFEYEIFSEEHLTDIDSGSQAKIPQGARKIPLADCTRSEAKKKGLVACAGANGRIIPGAREEGRKSKREEQLGLFWSA